MIFHLVFHEFAGGGLQSNLTLSLSSFPQSVAVSTGTGDGDFEKVSAVIAAVPQLKYICVDVANGYSEHFVHFVKDVRQKFPSRTIMVSGYIVYSFSVVCFLTWPYVETDKRTYRHSSDNEICLVSLLRQETW